MLHTVTGAVAGETLDVLLAAETVLRAPGPIPRNRGGAATDAAFERAPVSMARLGRLQMGALNRDDRTLVASDAEPGLRRLSDVGRAGVVALAEWAVPAEPEARTAALVGLSRASGVAIVRGTVGLEGFTETVPDADTLHTRILTELRHSDAPAGVVGRVGPLDPDDAAARDRLAGAASAARAGGVALVLAAAPTLADTDRLLAVVDSAGLRRERVILTRVARFPIDALLQRGTAVCFDDLGRIPTVRTRVSDHEVALAILRGAELGAGDRLLVSAGIRVKHRLTLWGGNGWEFISEQFLPHLRRLGASERLLHGVAVGNAARMLGREEPCT